MPDHEDGRRDAVHGAVGDDHAGEVKTTELVTISRPAVVSTLAGVGLMLDETKGLRQGSRKRGSFPGSYATTTV